MSVAIVDLANAKSAIEDEIETLERVQSTTKGFTLLEASALARLSSAKHDLAWLKTRLREEVALKGLK